jgi:hypothetical protein
MGNHRRCPILRGTSPLVENPVSPICACGNHLINTRQPGGRAVVLHHSVQSVEGVCVRPNLWNDEQDVTALAKVDYSPTALLESLAFAAYVSR